MKNLLFVVILTLVFSFCISKRHKVLRKNRPIVGGVATEVGKYPYQVSIGNFVQRSNFFSAEEDDNVFKNETQQKTRHFCGGAIISVVWVLSASHCLTREEIDDISIRVGSVTRDKEGHVHEVENIILHPVFEDSGEDCDIALIKVKVPFEIGPNVQPIPLNKYPLRPGTIVTVTGWGYIEGYESPEILQKVEVPIVPQWECKWLYENVDPEDRTELTETMFCAGRAGRDSCQGDSGGPVMYDGYLVGVVSWGYGCGLPGFPGVYTNVEKLRDWIRKNSGV